MKKMGIVVVLIFISLILSGCQNKKKYEIKFVDWDNTLIETQGLNKGDKVIAPNPPVREGYDFIGWDHDVTTAGQDLVITALYEKKSFNVTFKGSNGRVLKQETVLYQEAATAPEVVETGALKFLKWDKEFTNITNDLIVTAEYEEKIFTVTFKGLDGELLKTEKVLYGKSATAPEVSNTVDLKFSKWDKEFINVKSDLVITAIFVENKNLITFYDDSTVLELGIDSYKDGDTFVLPTPTKEGYAFSGWFLSDISLYEINDINEKFTGDLELYSRWVKTSQDLIEAPAGAIEFTGINKNPHSSGNGFVYQPQFPVGARSSSVTQYTWKSSNTKVATISAYSSISVASSGYAIITGTLTSDSTYVLYCVIQTSADGVVKASLEEANGLSYVHATFNLDDGTIIKKVVQKGGFVTPPTATPKTGYTFMGWVGPNGEETYNIMKDTTYTAVYAKATGTYAGKTISILGDSITTYSGYIPDGFSHFYPYPTANIGDVNQTWWMQVINKTGMELIANNSWAGSAVAGSQASAAQNKSRLEHLLIGEVKPDVILIFMGANDAGSTYISSSQFDLAYGKMLDNIKEMAPNSEIIICTLPSISMFTQSTQTEYNNIIKKHATQNGYLIVDFEQSFTREDNSNYLVDSAHPNKAGMNLLASSAINTILDKILVQETN